MTREKILEICDYLIVEPGFDDSPQRCFQLPQIACECLTSDQIQIVMDHLFDPVELMMGSGL
jgi:hypothetical protein